ncbi:MAG TPA: hypothetical protein VHZ29_02085 [Rhizomicrobium sp.]|jgi:hypothetical protein|nr:hypothetical protein [Rhizomicrobium sp.]
MTLAASPTFQTVSRDDAPAHSRGVGLLAIATGIAALALLAAHPGGDAKTFADVLKDEAANRLPNAIVHGGMVVVLALQMVCYCVFSVRLGLTRAATVAGLVFFAVGALFLSGSLVLDGLATPAVAARYLVAPAKIEYAKSLFVLMGSLIGILMPAGLAFQSAAIAAWGWALAASGKRAAGLLGLVLGCAMSAGAALGAVTMNPFALMGTIAGTAVWAMVVGAVMLRKG